MSDFHIERFQGKRGLVAIKDAWKRIVDSMPHKRYFHLYEFHLSYIDSLEKDDDSVHFYLIHRDQQPIAIMPLALRTVKIFGIPIRIYRLFPDTHHLVGLADCICCTSCTSLFPVLMDYVKTSKIGWDVLYIAKCLPDSGIMEALHSVHGRHYIREYAGRNGYVAKPELDNIGRKIATKTQAKSNRNLRKLRRRGTVAFTHAVRIPDLKKQLARFIALEDSGWKGGLGTSIKSDPQYARFYENLMEYLGGIGVCEINLLDLNEQSIAGMVTFTVDDTCYIAKVAYDESYAKTAPGMLMFEQLFRRLSETENITVCNFISFPPWINRWNYGTADVFRVLIFNATLFGRISALMMPLAKRIDRVQQFIKAAEHH